MKYALFFFITIFFYGCSDDYISQVHSKTILKQEIECIDLVVFPPNESIEETLHGLYDFNEHCEFNLIVSYKNSIVCNSNHNSDKKALGMAKSYLRLEFKKGNQLLYSYYKDLENNLEHEDIKCGFEVFEETLPLKAK